MQLHFNKNSKPEIISITSIPFIGFLFKHLMKPSLFLLKLHLNTGIRT